MIILLSLFLQKRANTEDPLLLQTAEKLKWQGKASKTETLDLCQKREC